MKKLAILSAGTASLAIAGFLLAPSLVGAQGGNGYGNGSGNGSGSGYGQMLETKAQILGITTEELQTQLKEKTLYQIIEEKGLTQDQFHEQMGTAAEARWQERGLSAEEIAQRQTQRAANQGDCDGTGGGRHGANR
jgi:hypothetical protein